MPAPWVDGDEISEIIAKVLLHDVVGAEMGGDLGIDLVPRTTHLMLQIAAQRAEIFVEFLCLTGNGMRSAHALTVR